MMELNRVRQAGFVLPLCLFITALISMVAVTMRQTANTELQLTATVIEAMQAHAMADYALNHAFESAKNNPDSLPALHASVENKPALVNTAGRSTVATVTATHTDKNCPGFIEGNRQHYEILVKAQTTGAGRTVHRLGFYVCTEVCGTPPCAESPSIPVRSFWTVNEWPQ